MPHIPAVTEEADQIKRAVNSSRIGSTIIELGLQGAPSANTKEAVLAALPSAHIVHFASHGSQNSKSPFHSSLYLSDQSEKLEVADLMEIDLSRAELAFLSACQTATGDKNDPDEVIHLSASLLFAGFKGVVGTMWSIADCDGPPVAKEFYEHLLNRESFDVRNAACALHAAVSILRSKGVSPMRWAPFIHIGV